MMKLFILFFLFSSFSCEDLKYSQQCHGWDCLHSYAFKEDNALKWELLDNRLEVEDYEGRGGWTGYYINMTSQAWLTPELTSQPEWWHMMVVVVPHNLRQTDTAMLWITDGSNHDDFLPDLDIIDGQFDYNLLVAADIATGTGTIVVSLYQVPNQSIRLYDVDGWSDNRGRSDDSLIAYTWLHYMEDSTNDTEYILFMPMVKAGVRAMDAATEFLTSDSAPQEIQDLNMNPTQWVVSGASKRGWTAWLVASVDPRVVATVPVVMDLLNFKENIMHQFKAYGGWSFALEPYWELNLTYYFDHPKFDDLASIMDPFEHRDKLIMPKLVVNCANDEFFNLDNTRYWWDDMPMAYEMNRFLMLPNADHPVVGAILEVLPAINTWIVQILDAQQKMKSANGGISPKIKSLDDRTEYAIKLMEVANIPRFSWTIDSDNGDITLESETDPLSVQVWHGSTCNTKRRDFRFLNLDDPCECGVAIESEGLCINQFIFMRGEELQETEPGSRKWIAHKRPPIDDRWMAFFIDVKYNASSSTNRGGWPFGSEGVFEFTSTVSIVHRNGTDVFPFEACKGGADCLGTIV